MRSARWMRILVCTALLLPVLLFDFGASEAKPRRLAAAAARGFKEKFITTSGGSAASIECLADGLAAEKYLDQLAHKPPHWTPPPDVDFDHIRQVPRGCLNHVVCDLYWNKSLPKPQVIKIELKSKKDDIEAKQKDIINDIEANRVELKELEDVNTWMLHGDMEDGEAHAHLELLAKRNASNWTQLDDLITNIHSSIFDSTFQLTQMDTELSHLKYFDVFKCDASAYSRFTAEELVARSHLFMPLIASPLVLLILIALGVEFWKRRPDYRPLTERGNYEKMSIAVKAAVWSCSVLFLAACLGIPVLSASAASCGTGFPWEYHAVAQIVIVAVKLVELTIYLGYSGERVGFFQLGKALIFGVMAAADVYTDMCFIFIAKSCHSIYWVWAKWAFIVGYGGAQVVYPLVMVGIGYILFPGGGNNPEWFLTKMAHMDLVSDLLPVIPAHKNHVAWSTVSTILRCILEDLVQAGIQVAFTCAVQYNPQVIVSIGLSAACSIGGMLLACHQCCKNL